MKAGGSSFIAVTILLAAPMASSFFSCDGPFKWREDIKDFVEDGKSRLSLDGFAVQVGGIDKTVVPSGREAIVTLEIINPRSIEVACVVECADETLFDALPSVTVEGENLVTFSFVPALRAERKDLSFTVRLSSPETGSEYPSESIAIRCNSPPSGVASSLRAAFDQDGRAFAAFRLPSSPTDGDLVEVRIEYAPAGTGSGGETATFGVDEACLCTKVTPFSGTDLLGTSNPLNRYFSPGSIPAAVSYAFSVTLIDDEGLESECATIASDEDGYPVFVGFTFNPAYAAIVFTPSTVSVERGDTLVLTPSLSGATDYHWFLDNDPKGTTSAFSWDTTGEQPGQYIVNVDAVYDGYVCTGSIPVTVFW